MGDISQEMGIMIDFTEKPICPKCRNQNFYWRMVYEIDPKPTSYEGDYLSLQCLRCGHVLKMKPADVENEANEPTDIS